MHFALFLDPMIIRTMRFRALSFSGCSTLLGLVVHWVVLELLPAVARAAAVLEPTAVTVGLSVFAGFPTCALLSLVFVKMG